MSEGAKEGWSYTQSECIDEDNQSESLTVVKHLLIYLQAETTRSDTKKEHKGNTK